VHSLVVEYSLVDEDKVFVTYVIDKRHVVRTSNVRVTLVGSTQMNHSTIIGISMNSRSFILASRSVAHTCNCRCSRVIENTHLAFFLEILHRSHE
jgi:hypothetical protein